MRLIAFYLPQYHPIPENDLWWGKGFTEWTNVAKAKPLFLGHQQPKLPGELGFYDLRVAEVRQAQADLAKESGIEGFCYWHYWFAGKKLLERPFEEVLKSGKPEFPFCLAWANQTWSGIWHGSPDKVLIEQTYPGAKDHEDHFYYLLSAFKDVRYLTIDNRNVFLIYKPDQIPSIPDFIALWRSLAKKEGIRDFYFMTISSKRFDYKSVGLDGIILNTFSSIRQNFESQKSRKNTFIRRIKHIINRFRRVPLTDFPLRYSYSDYVQTSLPLLENEDEFFLVVPNWDNTPRSGRNGIVLTGCNPDLFKKHLLDAINATRNHPEDKRIVFLKSWNEWAEGNYLEPDSEFGKGYLKAIKDLSANEICGNGK